MKDKEYIQIEVKNGPDLQAKLDYLGVEKIIFAEMLEKTRTTLYTYFGRDNFSPRMKENIEGQLNYYIDYYREELKAEERYWLLFPNGDTIKK
jgi:hypothetical protein